MLYNIKSYPLITIVEQMKYPYFYLFYAILFSQAKFPVQSNWFPVLCNVRNKFRFKAISLCKKINKKIVGKNCENGQFILFSLRYYIYIAQISLDSSKLIFQLCNQGYSMMGILLSFTFPVLQNLLQSNLEAQHANLLVHMRNV